MNKQKVFYFFKEGLFVLLFMTLVANAMSLYKAQDLNHNPLPLQTFTFLDGSRYTVEKNKPLLIHFWATWCPTCKLEADNIERLSKYYNVLTIAVQSGTDEEIKQYLKQHNYHFNVVNDHHSTLAKLFNITGYPTTFIYNKEHQLTFAEVGYTSTLGLLIRLWWSSF